MPGPHWKSTLRTRPRPARARWGVAGAALLALASGRTTLAGPAQGRLSPASRQACELLLFVMDDVAAADLALYGGPVATPNLERLARQGLTFTNAYANPVCGSTRRSLQFGRWWLRGNGPDCAPSSSPDTPTLAETSLAEALPGHTAVFLGKWHLGTARGNAPWECAPLLRGYDLWTAGLPTNVLGELFCLGSYGYREWLRVEASPLGCVAATSEEYHPRVVVDSFVDAWPRLPRPRLAAVNSNLAHAPFHRPPADMLPPGYPPTSTNRERYEAMIRALDDNLGELLAVVDPTRTLIAVVGDNGTPSEVAPDPERAKGTTFERGIRVPLVLAGGPTRKPGRRTHELVHVADLWSTLVEAGGGDASSDTSRSLLPALQDVPHPPFHDFVLAGNHWGSRRGDRCVVSADGFKLRQLDTDADEVPDVEALYDLTKDPGEKTDQLAALPELAEVLRSFAEAETP